MYLQDGTIGVEKGIEKQSSNFPQYWCIQALYTIGENISSSSFYGRNNKTDIKGNLTKWKKKYK